MWQGQSRARSSRDTVKAASGRQKAVVILGGHSASQPRLSAAWRTWFYLDALEGISGVCEVRMQDSGLGWTSEALTLQMQRPAWQSTTPEAVWPNRTEANTVLTVANSSNLPKSSLSSFTSSWAVHWDARPVKPTMSANRMLQKEGDAGHLLLVT